MFNNDHFVILFEVGRCWIKIVSDFWEFRHSFRGSVRFIVGGFIHVARNLKENYIVFLMERVYILRGLGK